MAKGRRVAHGRLDPFYIGIIIFIVVVLLAVTGGVILAGGFPSGTPSNDVSSVVSSGNVSSEAEDVSSVQPEDVSSAQQEDPQDSSAPSAESPDSSEPVQAAGFEEQFEKNQYDADFDQKMREAANNTQILAVYNEYINIWKEEITNVMEKLASALDGEQLQEVQSQQGEWESTIDANLEEQFAEMDQSGQGSLGNINRAEITYETYRGRAKELYQILYEADPGFTVG